METIAQSILSDYPEPDDQPEDWTEYEDEMIEEYAEEIGELLPSHYPGAGMDEDIEYGTIQHEEGFEGTIYMSEEIDIRAGKRTVTTPRESLVYGKSMKEFDFSGTPGEVITQQLRNGRWVTVSKTIVSAHGNDGGDADPLAKLQDMNNEEAKEYLLELLASGEIDNDDFETLYERFD